MLESRKIANDKYIKKCKRYYLALNPDNMEDSKIIEELEKHEKQPYIKKLILEDIRKNSK